MYVHIHSTLLCCCFQNMPFWLSPSDSQRIPWVEEMLSNMVSYNNWDNIIPLRASALSSNLQVNTCFWTSHQKITSRGPKSLVLSWSLLLQFSPSFIKWISMIFCVSEFRNILPRKGCNYSKETTLLSLSGKTHNDIWYLACNHVPA